METYENALPMRSQGEGASGAIGNSASAVSDSEQRACGSRVIEMPVEDFTAHGGMGFEYGAGRVNAASARRMHALREEIGDAPLTGIESRWAYRFFKRAFDIVFSAVVLVCFCWLYAIIAILVKADDPKGPVIFSQDRVGRDGGIFRMHKFRSMVADAEDRLGELQAFNEKTGPVFKIKNDPRVTRVGHWLRKLSLDELPQFWDVLKGDISIVGPRPALPKEVEKYTDYQRQRLLVKPGITCYWQTRRDRDSITFDEWVDLDLLYVRKCGPWTDFKLIIQTVGCVLTAQGS